MVVVVAVVIIVVIAAAAVVVVIVVVVVVSAVPPSPLAVLHTCVSRHFATSKSACLNPVCYRQLNFL